jgi:hypothetical protein
MSLLYYRVILLNRAKDTKMMKDAYIAPINGKLFVLENDLLTDRVVVNVL